MPAEIHVKSILNKSKRRDPWFLDDYTINPYSACSFNCLYCYIRGSKYGEHMQEKLSVKINAPELLEKQLHNRARKQQYGVIVLSSVTDPYLQVEEKYRLTRSLLEIILRYRFPVHIITKSPLVSRDLDLLEQISREAILPPELDGQLRQKAFISFSFSTLRDEVAKIFEPGAPAPSLRLQTLQQCLQLDFLAGVSFMPLLPYISDTGEELHHAFSTFSQMSVRYIFPAGISLFGETRHDSKQLVLGAVAKHYPQLLAKYQRMFGSSGHLPAYYQQAFYRKSLELCQSYGIRNRIIS